MRAIKKQLNYSNGNQSFQEPKIFIKVYIRLANGLKKIKKIQAINQQIIQFNFIYEKKKGSCFYRQQG